MEAQTAAFIKLARHPLQFRFFLLAKLPSAFFAGVRIKEIDENKCVVTVPYKWFSQNPFRSTYFACLSMAAELSTGALAMSNTYKAKPAISMLVTRVDSEYFKKASGKTIFTCEDGQLFHKMINEAVETGEPKIVRAKSVGRDEAGEVVAEMFISWSFKKRKI